MALTIAIAFFAGFIVGLIVLYFPLHREEMDVRWYSGELAKELSRARNLNQLLAEEVARCDEWLAQQQKKADEDAGRPGE